MLKALFYLMFWFGFGLDHAGTMILFSELLNTIRYKQVMFIGVFHYAFTRLKLVKLFLLDLTLKMQQEHYCPVFSLIQR